jgi:hypothetical protein
VERSTTSKTEKEIVHVIMDGNVGAPVPTMMMRMIVKKKIEKNEIFWMNVLEE